MAGTPAAHVTILWKGRAMTATLFVTLIRSTWLILCGMMLFSRFAFQWAGPIRMRAFLEGWKVSTTHRVWGLVALCWGICLLLMGLWVFPALAAWDRLLSVLLIGVLLADGLLNVLPSSFSQFKEQMQQAWVRHHPQPDRRDDRALFGTVNAALGVASVSVAAIVLVYRPIQAHVVVISLGVAVLLTAGLIGASLWEARHKPA
jgi:hypothetical protein